MRASPRSIEACIDRLAQARRGRTGGLFLEPPGRSGAGHGWVETSGGRDVFATPVAPQRPGPGLRRRYEEPCTESHDRLHLSRRRSIQSTNMIIMIIMIIIMITNMISGFSHRCLSVSQRSMRASPRVTSPLTPFMRCTMMSSHMTSPLATLCVTLEVGCRCVCLCEHPTN